MRDFASELQQWCRLALRLVPATGATKSYLGGDPRLPDSVPWPSPGGRRLAFLARVSLSEANADRRLKELPTNGALLFFYDTERQPAGWDPKDSEGFAVLLAPDLATPIDPVALAAESPPCRGVRAVPTETYPSWEHEAVASLNLSNEESDDYEHFVDAIYGDDPRHQLGGHASPIQGEGMELLCQLASSGHFCGHGDWSNLSAVLPQMKRAAQRWRLLLQIDSDNALGFEWGDAGTVYFWAPLDEGGHLQIARAWVAAQCC